MGVEPEVRRAVEVGDVDNAAFGVQLWPAVDGQLVTHQGMGERYLHGNRVSRFFDGRATVNLARIRMRYNIERLHDGSGRKRVPIWRQLAEATFAESMDKLMNGAAGEIRAEHTPLMRQY